MFSFLFIMFCRPLLSLFFFFNDTATTEIYTLSLHDALPISNPAGSGLERLLFRANQWWRGRLERESLRGYGRLPPHRDRCRYGRQNLGSHGLRAHANGDRKSVV